MERPVVVLDNGASVTKIGETGDEAPWEWVLNELIVISFFFILLSPTKDYAFNRWKTKTLGS